MQQQRQRNKVILGVLALGLLAGVALTAHPAQAQAVDAVGPYVDAVGPDVDVVGPYVAAVGPYYAMPAWARKMEVVNRFVVLTNWASAAVLDKETGLVWERRPSGTNNFSWSAARGHCLARTIGNHKGWRLPSMHELASLIDPARANPALPAGHPFVIVLPIVNVHWTATGTATATGATGTQAWFVNFFNGGVDNVGPKLGGQGNAWCVRGGMNADVY